MPRPVWSQPHECTESKDVPLSAYPQANNQCHTLTYSWDISDKLFWITMGMPSMPRHTHLKRLNLFDWNYFCGCLATCKKKFICPFLVEIKLTHCFLSLWAIMNRACTSWPHQITMPE